MSDADETAEAESSKDLVKPSRAERKEAKQADKAERKADRKAKGNLFARIMLFIRQTVAELRKVIWPTRSELINYTWVVLVFVFVMAVIIGVMDFGFGKLVLVLFG